MWLVLHINPRPVDEPTSVLDFEAVDDVEELRRRELDGKQFFGSDARLEGFGKARVRRARVQRDADCALPSQLARAGHGRLI